MDIELTQRGGPAVVRRQDYEDYWATGLSVLVGYRIVRLEHHGEYTLVYPSQYVGYARCGGRRLVIKPKFDELLLQLRRNFPLNRRDAPLQGFDPTHERSVVSDLIIRFLHTLSEVVNQGVPFHYVKHTFAGPSLRGHLSVGKTIRRFTTRNIHHEAVTERRKKTTDPAIVDVLWRTTTCLSEIGALSQNEEAMLGVFLTAVGPPADEPSLSEAIAITERASDLYSSRLDVVALMRCCRDVLSLDRTEHDIEASTGNVLFTFTDVDALWERAVHQATRQAVAGYGWQSRLHPLRGSTIRMFADGGPQIDPDVLVYSDNAPLIAFDAKDFAQRSPEASGVYQVAAYARTLQTPAAALIYLATEEDWLEVFGDSSVAVYAVGVRPSGTDVLIRLTAACAAIAEQVFALAPTTPAA